MIAATETEAREEIGRFLDSFTAAFATFDGGRVAVLFAPPAVALRKDGSRTGFATADDVAAYYQAALDRYRAMGCRACRGWDADIRFLNETTASVAVSWDLLGADGVILSSWRQAYLLAFVDGEWRCFASAFVSELGRGVRP